MNYKKNWDRSIRPTPDVFVEDMIDCAFSRDWQWGMAGLYLACLCVSALTAICG